MNATAYKRDKSLAYTRCDDGAITVQQLFIEWEFLADNGQRTVYFDGSTFKSVGEGK
jgi:hypothetical protein